LLGVSPNGKHPLISVKEKNRESSK